MTEWEKAQQGYLYDANYDQEIVDARTKCADLCYAFNACRPSDIETQEKLIREMLGEVRGGFVITAPFYCVVAAGNPCRVIRKITEADKEKYPIWKE